MKIIRFTAFYSAIKYKLTEAFYYNINVNLRRCVQCTLYTNKLVN